MENRSRSRSAIVTLTPSTAMAALATSAGSSRSGGRIQIRRQLSSAVDARDLADRVDEPLDQMTVEHAADGQRQLDVDRVARGQRVERRAPAGLGRDRGAERPVADAPPR